MVICIFQCEEGIESKETVHKMSNLALKKYQVPSEKFEKIHFL